MRLNLDDGVEPLEVEYEGKAYAVIHPADLPPEALETLAALGELESKSEAEAFTEEMVAKIRQMVRTIAPEMPQVSLMRAVRLLTWYSKILAEYMEGFGAPKSAASPESRAPSP